MDQNDLQDNGQWDLHQNLTENASLLNLALLAVRLTVPRPPSPPPPLDQITTS